MYTVQFQKTLFPIFEVERKGYPNKYFVHLLQIHPGPACK